MISLLRPPQWPIARRCPRPLCALHSARLQPPVSSPSTPHRFASSRPQRPRREDGPWTTYYNAFRKNIYFRTTSLALLSGTLLYFGWHLEAVPDIDGRRRFMLVSGDSIEKQCLVKYRLLREKLKQYLVGTEDERVRKVHFVLERLLDGNELKGKGKRWEIMVVQNDIDPTSSGSLAYILPGNKLIIGTTIISSLSDTELAHLLSHSIAHLLLQHRRENESLLHLITPFVWTFPVLDWKMYFAQVPILWVFGNYYGKRLREKQEEEAERMAARMVENAGFVKVVGGLDGFWRCANLS